MKCRTASRAIAAEFGKRLAPEPSRALIIDYGYARERHGDTLQALASTKADPLDGIGIADLTAHVDFAALTAAAHGEGAQVFGPISQRDFLRAVGIETRLAALAQGECRAKTNA